MKWLWHRYCALFILACGASAVFAEQDASSDASNAQSPAKVSFQRDVLPILQANCQGCHQPARAQGGYVMTEMTKLVSGGESGEVAVVPGKPEESELIRQVAAVDGKAAMPKGKPPLSAPDVEVLKKWIAEGAINDSPADAGPRYSVEHPPQYARPPVITSLDFSPDGKLLAVAGYHEVLLVDASNWQTTGRLIGLSERIESVKFSPDGSKLLVTGGQPCLMGEAQIWNVSSKELLLSIPVTHDTIYGGSWSPDGKLVSVGGADKSVRAFDAETGEQRLFQGAHDDWVRATVFNSDGAHLISAGLDMTVKLTEVATERFIDNITSITPGALRGGVNALASHPQRNEILVGGADGVAKIYRIFRETERKIGDDANLIRRLPAMTGRIFSVAISRDAQYLAAASTLDGQSQVRAWKYDLESALPDDIKAINRKRVQERSEEEKNKLNQFQSAEVPALAKLEIPEAAVYSLAFSAEGTLAIGMSDGRVRVVRAESGETVTEFVPVEVGKGHAVPAATPATPLSEQVAQAAELRGDEQLPKDAKINKLVVSPESIQFSGPSEYSQLLVTAQLADGSELDVTRLAEYKLEGPSVAIDARGVLRPIANGESRLLVSLGEQQAAVPVQVKEFANRVAVDFIKDLNPVLSRLGCNQGTCHGAAKGKNGFKLSLRGYDATFDVRSLTDDMAARRVNIAAPDASLMLSKALGVVPHEGGKLISRGDSYYSLIREWIANGCELELQGPRVASIEVTPTRPVIPMIGQKQQVRVVATYTNGTRRDVTQEAFIESGNTEVATVDRYGLLASVRRGEAPILARYEGAYAAATLTVMGDRTGFQWQAPESWGRVDELVAKKWERLKIAPSELTSDAEFLRRVYLDLTGLPPTAETVLKFIEDQRPTREKRNEVVSQLIGSESFIEHWSNKWADLLQVNSKFLGKEGAKSLRDWIRKNVAENVPYDQFAAQVLTATGSNKDNPAASYFKILRTPEDTMENTTHLFLGVRFNCNKCHDHPFERWTQDQYYQTAAYFAQFALKPDPASGDKKIGGTAVEGAKPLYEEVYDKPNGEVTHERTGKPAEPKFPFECDHAAPEKASRRQALASWMTSPDNQYFARSYVNRLWGYLLGVGLIEPIDDLRAGNPPTNPELLDYLTEEFIKSKFDMRYMLQLICTSRTYQLSVATNPWNEDDRINYSHAMPRRLPAEVLFDAIHTVIDSKLKIPGVPEGTRAAALPDVAVNLPDGFLNNLGRPVRESACECERSAELQLGPVMALASGPTVGQAIGDKQNCLAGLVKGGDNQRQIIEDLYLRILSRPATEAEIEAGKTVFADISNDHQRLEQQLAERESWWKEERPKLEKARLDQLVETEKQLAALRESLRPERERLEKERADRIAKATADLKKYETEELVKQRDRLLANPPTTDWHLLAATKLEATGKAVLTRQADRSIVASGEKEKGVYTVTASTSLEEITALRLEALAAADLPGGGPGRPENGNFVVTELEISVATAEKPTEFKKLAIKSAVATFSQDTFDPKQVFDGATNDQRGWAISPATGMTHWAVFRLTEAVKLPKGSILQIKLHQFHNAVDHRLGRFRLAVTNEPGETPLGLSEEFAALATIDAKSRSAEQNAVVLAHLQKTDKGLRDRQTALNVANTPVPADPQIVAMEKRVESLKQETADDRKLVQLRSDFEQSKQQLQQQSLTAAQDLAWALINSPAFLFNR